MRTRNWLLALAVLCAGSASAGISVSSRGPFKFSRETPYARIFSADTVQVIDDSLSTLLQFANRDGTGWEPITWGSWVSENKVDTFHNPLTIVAYDSTKFQTDAEDMSTLSVGPRSDLVEQRNKPRSQEEFSCMRTALGFFLSAYRNELPQRVSKDNVDSWLKCMFHDASVDPLNFVDRNGELEVVIDSGLSCFYIGRKVRTAAPYPGNSYLEFQVVKNNTDQWLVKRVTRIEAYQNRWGRSEVYSSEKSIKPEYVPKSIVPQKTSPTSDISNQFPNQGGQIILPSQNPIFPTKGAGSLYYPEWWTPSGDLEFKLDSAKLASHPIGGFPLLLAYVQVQSSNPGASAHLKYARLVDDRGISHAPEVSYDDGSRASHNMFWDAHNTQGAYIPLKGTKCPQARCITFNIRGMEGRGIKLVYDCGWAIGNDEPRPEVRLGILPNRFGSN